MNLNHIRQRLNTLHDALITEAKRLEDDGENETTLKTLTEAVLHIGDAADQIKIAQHEGIKT